MTSKGILIVGALSAVSAVVLGAFGAHVLKKQLSPEMLGVFQTAVQYHLYHSLALLIIGLIALHIRSSLLLDLSAVFMIAGLVLFSGSLYALAVTGIQWFGIITPIGGAGFIIAWLLLSGALWRAEF
jgi:uncharacterized membrane protein YgdD (TMEM256/DUF423 family)